MIENLGFRCVALSTAIWIATTGTSIAETTNNSTMWKPVNKSLTELLNSGWKIASHSSNRVVTSPGTSGNILYDESNYTYILYKDGKYTHCLIIEPRPDKAFSWCRQLN